MSVKKIILLAPLVIAAAVVSFVVFVKYFGYSTPIPASNEQEKAFYEKRAQEWKSQQEQAEAIK